MGKLHFVVCIDFAKSYTPVRYIMKFLISIGSYERIIYGLDVESVEGEDSNKLNLTAKVGFAIPAHNGYIKCIASCPKYLVSGSVDEVIRIFDLKKRKDIGSINQHDGSIKALDFYDSTHLISAADDGLLVVHRTKDWECLEVLKKHKNPIQDMQIHPSGKLAVAIDDAKNLTLWNLITGKLAYSSKIPALGKIDRIVWSGTGRYYALLGETHILVYEAQTSQKVVDLRAGTLVGKVRSEKWLAATFVHDEALLFAGESGKLHMIRMSAPSDRLLIETGHKPRIRALKHFSPSKGSDLIITASSDGLINIFEWTDVLGAMKPNGETTELVEPIYKHNSELRITCLTVTSQ